MGYESGTAEEKDMNEMEWEGRTNVTVSIAWYCMVWWKEKKHWKEFIVYYPYITRYTARIDSNGCFWIGRGRLCQTE